MYWKDIPSQVKAEDEIGSAKAMLSDRFQQAIDAAAMADGSVGTDAYLEGWAWAKKQDRPGTAQDVLDAVVAELEAEYPQDRLREMIRERKAS
jgi:Virulence factor